MYPVRTHLVVSCSSAVIAVEMVESCPWDLKNTNCFIEEPMAIHASARIIIPAALSSREEDAVESAILVCLGSKFEDCWRTWIIRTFLL